MKPSSGKELHTIHTFSRIFIPYPQRSFSLPLVLSCLSSLSSVSLSRPGFTAVQVMHKLVHPHIVGYLGAELQDSKRRLCIFQEWVPAGSLHSLLDQFGALSDAMTRKYTRQVLEGLTYLHAHRVIHRDVKSKNILVDDRGNVKVGGLMGASVGSVGGGTRALTAVGLSFAAV